MTLLFTVALIFLPNIGLWSLYKDKHLVKSPEPGEQQVSTTQRTITELVRHATGGDTWKHMRIGLGPSPTSLYRAGITIHWRFGGLSK